MRNSFKFSTRAATYLVIIDTLKGLPITTRDAAFGLTGLFALYAIRILCDFFTKRYPRRGKCLIDIGLLELTLQKSESFFLHLCVQKCIRHRNVNHCLLVIHKAQGRYERQIPY